MQPQVVLVRKTPRFTGSLGSVTSSVGGPLPEALIGAAVGSIVGALVGLAIGHPDYGAIAGVVAGGGAGYWAGVAGQTQNTNALAQTAWNESGGA
jgi:hypothetical protein